jgi:hypothetical protein
MLNPDTLQPASGEELRERASRTGEIGNGKTVLCRPNLLDPNVVEQVSRAVCVTTPYAACLSCPHHHFEYIFALPESDTWVLCPRWNKEAGTGPPDYYVPVWLSECRATPHSFCMQCPGQDELAQLSTNKQKDGWLERYRKLLMEGEDA